MLQDSSDLGRLGSRAGSCPREEGPERSLWRQGRRCPTQESAFLSPLARAQVSLQGSPEPQTILGRWEGVMGCLEAVWTSGSLPSQRKG